jgi:16S rRNA (guanine527-N7)-methyltransferase
MNKEEFINEVKKLGINITEKELDLLDKYYHLLINWNEKINLTTITKEEDVYLKHFYDSLTLVKEIDFNKEIYLCDVGSGAGLPGIVIKIFFPNVKIKLIDSLQKRVNYLNEVIKELNLTNISAEHFRMEDYSKIHPEEFDVITARAVAHLGILAEISIKALKINGNMVFMKGNATDEIDAFLANSKKLGLILDSVNTFKLPLEYSNRTLIKLTKISKTNDIYPRRIDVIKKEYIK